MELDFNGNRSHLTLILIRSQQVKVNQNSSFHVYQGRAEGLYYVRKQPVTVSN